MTFAPNSNATNHSHEDQPREQGKHTEMHEHREATDRPRGPGNLRIKTQHCILCQTETVGACLICHRPLCEQCGQSDDDFLRCRAHHQDQVEALCSTLRQAALSVIGTKQYVTDLVALRNRVLHEVSVALLRSSVEHTGEAPSPAQVRQMRHVAFALWNSLACLQVPLEPAVLDTHRAGRKAAGTRGGRKGVDQARQQASRQPEKRGPL